MSNRGFSCALLIWLLVVASPCMAAEVRQAGSQTGTTRDCSRWFGARWDDRCLLDKLRDPNYFGIGEGAASDQQLLDYIKANREGIAALLLQIDYGRDIQRFVTNRDRILLTENERAFVVTLGKAGTITQMLGLVASVLNALQQTAAGTAASESLGVLRQILFGIQVYERAAQVSISQGMRTVLDTYFYYRQNSTREAAWREISTTQAFDRPLLQMSRVKQIPSEKLNEWFENAYVAYRLAGYADSADIRRAQGRALARLVGGSAAPATAFAAWEGYWYPSTKSCQPSPYASQQIRLELHQNGEQLTGTLSGPGILTGRISGTLKQNQLNAALDYGVRPPDGSLTATISGNQLRGFITEYPRAGYCTWTGPFDVTLAGSPTPSMAAEAGQTAVQTASAKDCAGRFGSGWDDQCLLERLRAPNYFGISPEDAPDQQLLDYIKANEEEIAALLLQIDYGRDIQRFVTNRDRILLTENERAFVVTLGKAGTITQMLGQVASVLNALQQTAAGTAASESLGVLRQILFGIQVYERAAQVSISQGMRTVLDTYFYYRQNSTREAAWREISTTQAFDRPLLQMSRVKQIPSEKLNEWFENAYVAYRLSASPGIRKVQGQALARLTRFVGDSDWQELWEGSVRGPGWTEPVRMVVRRNFDELIGTVTFGRSGPVEMKGKIDAEDRFVLRDWAGLVWEGQMGSDIVSGVRPNGPPDDPNVPRFPFELKRVRPISDAELPASLPPTSSDWNTFYARFKDAVRRRDRSALKAMMARNFLYAHNLNPPPEFVFSELEYGGGTNWTIFERTLALGIEVGRDSPLGRPTRVAKNPLPCRREPCKYQVWVTFEQDDDKQWRWTGMIFPGD